MNDLINTSTLFALVLVGGALWIVALLAWDLVWLRRELRHELQGEHNEDS